MGVRSLTKLEMLAQSRGWPAPPLGSLWLVSFVAVTAAGCGKRIPLGEVAGTVRLNGQPLENVAVTFVPDAAKGTMGPHSTSSTDAAGHYQLRCEDFRSGASVGWHRVIVEDLLPYSLPRDDDTPPPRKALKSRVPRAYADPARTPLQVEVKLGEQTIDLDLS